MHRPEETRDRPRTSRACDHPGGERGGDEPGWDHGAQGVHRRHERVLLLPPQQGRGCASVRAKSHADARASERLEPRGEVPPAYGVHPLEAESPRRGYPLPRAGLGDGRVRRAGGGRNAAAEALPGRRSVPQHCRGAAYSASHLRSLHIFAECTAAGAVVFELLQQVGKVLRDHTPGRSRRAVWRRFYKELFAGDAPLQPASEEPLRSPFPQL
mmetsp:Transcript_27618/g.75205  ORF Transcript_27618/g.75205 Transcript_27618/m.75205 type:complete len:213 (-) Transcript_27618:213-851(-)